MITNEDCSKITQEIDPEFRAFVAQFDPNCWARYDLAALRIGWKLGRKALEQAALERERNVTLGE